MRGGLRVNLGVVTAAGLWVSLGMLGPQVCGALTLRQVGYTAWLVRDLPQGAVYGDLEVDQTGNLFFPTSSSGVKELAAGVLTDWSAAPAVDMTLAASGDGYGAGRANCDCIFGFQSDGSYTTLHQDSLQWAYMALTPDGTLYSSIWAGPGQGLYVVDRIAGEPTLLVSGGPKPGGAGVYFGMASGADGKLYVLGSDTGGSNNQLFRLEGSQFVAVASLPHTGIWLALGPSGVFYVAAQYQNGAGYPAGDVWIVDPSSGESTLLASSGQYLGLEHPTLGGIGVDSYGTIYVLEAYKLWAITKNSTPAISKSWGAIKAGYR